MCRERFSRNLDYAEKLARRLGAHIEERVVHAVDHVNIAV